MTKKNNQYKSAIDSMDQSITDFPDALNADNNIACDLFMQGPIEIKKKPINLSLANVRHTKRLMREVLSDILHIENEQGDSNLELIMDTLVQKAVGGDLRAIELISKIMAEVSDQKVEVSIPAISIHVDGDSSGIRFSENPDKEP